MNILAIESSCDETAAAIISGDPASPRILSNVVVSQIDIFKAYGGVIPEVAARSHLEAILPVIHQAFKEANFTKPNQPNQSVQQPDQPAQQPNQNPTQNDQTQSSEIDDWSKIDAIAVTHTPGLLGSLLIGTLTARTLAILHHKPLYAVHHLKSHIYANWLNTAENQATSSDTTTPAFPLLALVISGGHTQIIRMTAHNNFEIIGTTLDDAVGECFDKVAKILGLPYPGGPSISQAAQGKITTMTPDGNLQTTHVTPGDPKKYHLPHPKIKNLDFSFSGLKTAVLRAVQKAVDVPISYPSHQLAALLTDQQKADFAASFEQTAIEILLEKLEKSLTEYPDIKSIVIAGGVSANQRLREKAHESFDANNHNSQSTIPVFFPAKQFSGDNAAMVGVAALYEIASHVQPTDPYQLNILPRSTIL